MKKFLIHNNLSVIQKMCLAALFLSITTILQKVVAVNYIPAVPFLRVSPGGPAMIIFSSVLLGPWYGLLVGAGSDLIGYFVLDRSGYPLYPQITAIYALLGFSSYFLFCLFRFLKNRKAGFILEGSFLLLCLAAVAVYLFASPSVRLYSSTYSFSLGTKILVISVLAVLAALLFLFVFLINRRFQDKIIFNAYQISMSCLVLEIAVMVVFGTLMKGIAFGFGTYPAILVCQIMVLFFNVPVNTLLISLFLRATGRYFVTR